MSKFFAAQNEAYDWLHKTPMEEVAKMVAPILVDSHMDGLRPALKRISPGVPTVATVDKTTYTTTMKTDGRRPVSSKRRLPFEKSVDNTFAARGERGGYSKEEPPRPHSSRRGISRSSLARAVCVVALKGVDLTVHGRRDRRSGGAERLRQDDLPQQRVRTAAV